MPARRPRFRRRFRRRRGTLYEMQEISFTREPLVLPETATEALPSVDVFEIVMPRLEWSTDAGDPGKVPAIVKGATLRGIHHRTLISYVPRFSDTPTATAIAFVTVHMAIVRVPIDTAGTPLALPNLYLSEANEQPGNISPGHYRILWRGLDHIRVFDGTLPLNLAGLGVPTQADVVAVTDRRDFSDISFIRTKSACRMTMDQGLFLLVQCVHPFTFAEPGELTLGLDTFMSFGIKNQTRGSNYV